MDPYKVTPPYLDELLDEMGSEATPPSEAVLAAHVAGGPITDAETIERLLGPA